ncbi:hypothetical protein AB0O87_06225 [Microbacterium sp. NPDC076768]|uniref:hypothetical protein n=1 Tax=Microbacterium sp. NPDC076768 TaxID=3154858 RepID=UPI0034232685
MIDARDHIGVPTITDCPHIAKHEGVTYEVWADIGMLREGDLSFTVQADPFADDFARMWSAYMPPLVTDRVTMTFAPA